VLVLIVGLVSLILTLIRRYHGLFYSGAGILGLLIYFVFSWGAGLLLVGAILVIVAAAYGNPASAIRQSFVGDAKKVLARAKKVFGPAMVIGWASAWQPAFKTLLGW
jgi:hypothetical protein